MHSNASVVSNASAGRQLSVEPLYALVGCFLSLFVCVTVLGNSLVILAVVREHCLRTITNYFIVSLATADLLMGAVVMPFSVVSYVTGEHWLFGQAWCDLWHAFDVLSSTASILNLCMIAVERYLAIENPIRYPVRVTKRRCLLVIAAVWLCSSLISFPAITWWQATGPPRQPNTCQFTSDPIYLVCSSLVSFYGPLLVMVFVYCKIYRTATRLVRSWRCGAKILQGRGQQATVVLRIHRGRREVTPAAATAAVTEAPEAEADDEEEAGDREEPRQPPQQQQLARLLSARSVSDEDAGGRGSAPCSRSSSAKRLRSVVDTGDGGGVRKRFLRFSREQRAAKTLGVVMGVFIACWLPFFVCSVVAALSPTGLGRHEKAIMVVVTWLGYFNSSVNPGIYAHSMRDFRRAFLRLLRCSRLLDAAGGAEKQLRRRQLLMQRQHLEHQRQNQQHQLQHQQQHIGLSQVPPGFAPAPRSFASACGTELVRMNRGAAELTSASL